MQPIITHLKNWTFLQNNFPPITSLHFSIFKVTIKIYINLIEITKHVQIIYLKMTIPNKICPIYG